MEKAHVSSYDVLIVGLGTTGKAVLEYFISKKYTCLVADDTLKEGSVKSALYDEYPHITIISPQSVIQHFTPFSFTIRCFSPGVSPHHILAVWCENAKACVTSELDIAHAALADILPTLIPKKKRVFLGITGTNGKTTTTELTTHILNHIGYKAASFGNIGRPLIELCSHTPSSGTFYKELLYSLDAYVIELSSYQLERMRQKVFTAGAWLNLTPDHLDWHDSIDAYKKAKEQLIQLLCTHRDSEDDANSNKADTSYSYFFAHISLYPIHDIPCGVKIVYYGLILDRNDSHTISKLDVWADNRTFSIRGKRASLPSSLWLENGAIKHDVENFLVAASLVFVSYECSLEKIAESYTTFSKGAHRIEHVVTTKKYNISFYNDSKATNIHATIAAVETLPAPIILIVGGVHKGYSYSEWKTAFKEKVKAVIAIGLAKDKIAKDIHNSVEHIMYAQTLTQAVEIACVHAKTHAYQEEKATVLLSPGCSSFDMFDNYQDRGIQFKNIVYTVTAKDDL